MARSVTNPGPPSLEGWYSMREAAQVLGISRQMAHKIHFHTLRMIGDRLAYVVSKDEVHRLKQLRNGDQEATQEPVRRLGSYSQGEVPRLAGWIPLAEVAQRLGVSLPMIYKMQWQFDTLRKVGDSAVHLVEEWEVEKIKGMRETAKSIRIAGEVYNLN